MRKPFKVKEDKDDDKPVERTAQEDAAHIKDGFVIDKSPKIMNTNVELDGVDAETASKITGKLAEKNDKMDHQIILRMLSVHNYKVSEDVFEYIRQFELCIHNS